MFWLRKLRITVLLTFRSAIAHKHGKMNCLLGIFWDGGSFPDSPHYSRWEPCQNCPPWGHDVWSKTLPWGYTSVKFLWVVPPLLGLDTDRYIIIFTHAFTFVSSYWRHLFCSFSNRSKLMNWSSLRQFCLCLSAYLLLLPLFSLCNTGWNPFIHLL